MSFLDQIAIEKQEELALLKKHRPLDQLRQQAEASSKPSFSFLDALRADRQLSVIAEVKGASPSQGTIKQSFKPVDIAQNYQNAGASALSVLTEEKHFQGKLQYLEQISQSVSLPCLRKDFFIDSYQVYEARLAGASAILLIAAMLTRQQMADLIALADSLSLDVLMEVHSFEDLRKVEGLPLSMIGVNNRNLKDLSVDLQRGLDMKAELPSGLVSVCESGLSSVRDFQKVREAGFDAVLVGTALMQADDPGAKLKELLGD